MRIILEILDGPLAGRTIEADAGQSVSVGRTARAQIMLPQDSFLSGAHFQVESSQSGFLVRDLNSSNGTFLNGSRVEENTVRDGDVISAGQTRFLVHLPKDDLLQTTEVRRSSTVTFAAPDLEAIEAAGQQMAAATEAPSLTLDPTQRAIVGYLEGLRAPLYGLLSAPAEERIPKVLMGFGETFQAIDEERGPDSPLPNVHLVQFQEKSQLLSRLVHQRWGTRTVIFFDSIHPFMEVRKHVRQLSLLHTEDGRSLVLRFWDAKLLEVILNEMSKSELGAFFGPIRSFVIEGGGEGRQILEFTLSAHGLSRKTQSLV
jgi:pSer/pThr/pTyr-binding forkhead associated (FHA) protein